MNFDEAVKSHAQWKLNLKRYLDNPDGSIRAVDLQKDNLCELGKWLYSDEVAALRELPEFKQLVEEHKKFHMAAAEIVRRRDGGEEVDQYIALGSSSLFAETSAKMIHLLAKIKCMLKVLTG